MSEEESISTAQIQASALTSRWLFDLIAEKYHPRHVAFSVSPQTVAALPLAELGDVAGMCRTGLEPRGHRRALVKKFLVELQMCAVMQMGIFFWVLEGLASPV